MTAYGEDLAYIHDQGFSSFAREAAEGVVEMLGARGLHGGLIVDVGCGSGILSRELSLAGYEVLGFDASPAMIALATRAAPDIRFEPATFGGMRIPRCNAVVAVGEVLNHGTLTDLHHFTAAAAEALPPGGLLLFDVAERAAPAHEEYRDGGDDWSVIVVRESDGVSATRRVLTFRRVGESVQRDDELHRLELYERAALLALLASHGFRVRVRRSYGRHRLPRGHAVYVCDRR